MKRVLGTAGTFATAIVLLAAFALPANANHSWGGYHWARTSNPFTLLTGDNVSNAWDSYLNTAASDWTQSTVLDMTVTTGQSSGKHCRATPGRVEVCSGSYGNNGWLGVAQIWLARGSKHITQGTVRVNDYYFNLAPYNNSSEKLHVMCQEVGHTLGLDHQSEDGTSLNTCMDYYHNTSDSDTKSTHPNAHDYQQLQTIYSHNDSTTTVGTSAATSPSRESVSVRTARDGSTVITFILWV